MNFSYSRLTQIIFRLSVIMTVLASVSACKREIGPGPVGGGLEFSKFSLLAENNPGTLEENLDFAIGTDKITGRTTTYTQINSLIPVFSTNADSVTANGQLVESGETPVDFTGPVHYKLYGKDGNTKQYDVLLTNFTGLPIINIHTEGEQPINSKDNYLDASITINGIGDFPDFEGNMKIKGHGNSTWTQPKKPYKFKFDSKNALLGMAKGKSWILLANYIDLSAIRNELSMAFGRVSKLDWTPHMQFAELYVNDSYRGTYQLAEQIKINKERVNISDDGYLLEVDNPSKMDDDDIFFETPRMTVTIKDPDIDPGSSRYNYIKDYINMVEGVLYSDNFKDPNEGYAKYMDVTSFVDWYLINEIAKNNDAIFYSSCYMNIAPDGKLKMGPLWDFDLAFGNDSDNDNMNPKGFWVQKAVWISRLFEDPAFVAKVKTRFKYFREQLDDLMETIDQNADQLQWSMFENNKVWTRLSQDYTSQDAVGKAYDTQISTLKDWLNTRMDWLQTTFDQM